MSVPSLSHCWTTKVKMAVMHACFEETAFAFESFLSCGVEHLLSYESLTTLLISLTMEGTLSEINNQFRRQVNKRVLRIVQGCLRDNAKPQRKSTSCLNCQFCVHKAELKEINGFII